MKSKKSRRPLSAILRGPCLWLHPGQPHHHGVTTTWHCGCSAEPQRTNTTMGHSCSWFWAKLRHTQLTSGPVLETGQWESRLPSLCRAYLDKALLHISCAELGCPTTGTQEKTSMSLKENSRMCFTSPMIPSPFELPPQIQMNSKPHNSWSMCDQLCPVQFSCFVMITITKGSVNMAGKQQES